MLADDHPIMRDDLRDALQDEGDFEVVGLARDGVEAVRMVQSLAPEVIVMDVMMPHKDGVDACREIMQLRPDTRVLMLTASTTEDAVIEAITAGATGYLQKDSGPEELAEAIRDVAQGLLRIPDRSIRRVLAMVRSQRGLTANRALDGMTAVEQEILTMFASGRSYAQIAEPSGTKTVGVRNAVYRIQDKVGVHSKQELVVWAGVDGLDNPVSPPWRGLAVRLTRCPGQRGQHHAPTGSFLGRLDQEFPQRDIDVDIVEFEVEGGLHVGRAYEARRSAVLASHPPQFLAFGERHLQPEVAAGNGAFDRDSSGHFPNITTTARGRGSGLRAGCSASTFILVAVWEQSLHPDSPGQRLAHRKGPLNADIAVRTTGLPTARRNPGTERTPATSR